VLNDQKGEYLAQVGMAWILPVTLLLIVLISAVTIFLFRNRKLQMLLVISVIVISVVLIAAMTFYACYSAGNYNIYVVPGFKMVLPLLILIFSIMAFRGILKDDRLVKSYDRLR